MGNFITKDELQRQRIEFIQYYNRGDYNQAIQVGYKELDYLSKHDVNDFEEKSANTLNKMADAHYYMGDLESGITLCKRALDLLLNSSSHENGNGKKKKDYSESAILALTFSNLGCFYKESGNADREALIMLEGALRIREKIEPDSLPVARNYGNIATCLKDPKDKLEARQNEIRIKRKCAPNSWTLAKALLNFSNELNTIQHKFALVKEAQSIVKKCCPHKHEGKVLTKACLANAHVAAKEYEKAIPLYKHAIGIEESKAPNSLMNAELNKYLADTLEKIGGDTQLEEAKEARKKFIQVRAHRAPATLLPEKAKK